LRHLFKGDGQAGLAIVGLQNVPPRLAQPLPERVTYDPILVYQQGSLHVGLPDHWHIHAERQLSIVEFFSTFSQLFLYFHTNMIDSESSGLRAFAL
jgi:hypothetical protein